mmetsp:Transcript_25357/g.83358  ORF Transcript_25357/g.83358 Transcript_25357/m.83358 type:complete len:345 (-) Transcript_25357:473-1507(-)
MMRSSMARSSRSMSSESRPRHCLKASHSIASEEAGSRRTGLAERSSGLRSSSASPMTSSSAATTTSSSAGSSSQRRWSRLRVTAGAGADAVSSLKHALVGGGESQFMRFRSVCTVSMSCASCARSVCSPPSSDDRRRRSDDDARVDVPLASPRGISAPLNSHKRFVALFKSTNVSVIASLSVLRWARSLSPLRRQRTTESSAADAPGVASLDERMVADKLAGGAAAAFGFSCGADRGRRVTRCCCGPPRCDDPAVRPRTKFPDVTSAVAPASSPDASTPLAASARCSASRAREREITGGAERWRPSRCAASRAARVAAPSTMFPASCCESTAAGGMSGTCCGCW